MGGVGEPPATGLQSSHAAPTELDSAGGPLRYKYGAPTGAWTDPREDPCKERPLAAAPKLPGGGGVRVALGRRAV